MTDALRIRWRTDGTELDWRVRLAGFMSNDELLERAIVQLEGTESARELAAMLRERRDDIEVLDAPDPRLPEGAGGRWDPARGKLLIYRNQLEHPAGATLLAHEAQHMADRGGLATTFGHALLGVGRAVGGMLLAPLRLTNPVSAAIDGVRSGFQVPAEAAAYHLQAEVAEELGLYAPSLQHEDRSPRSERELARDLLEHPLYQLPPVMRTTIGAGFAYVGGRASGQLANAAIARLAPSSWPARHPVAVTVGTMALFAGLLVQDHLAARATHSA